MTINHNIAGFDVCPDVFYEVHGFNCRVVPSGRIRKFENAVKRGAKFPDVSCFPQAHGGGNVLLTKEWKWK